MNRNRLSKENATNWINAAIKTNERLRKRKSIIRPHSAYSKVNALQLLCGKCDAQLEWKMANFNLLNEDILSCPKCKNEMYIPTMVIYVC